MKYGTIFSDMDGVLCNFNKAANHALGMDINSHAFEAMNPAVRNKLFSDHLDTVAFWANMEPMPDFGSYWGYIKYWSPSILTAYPSWGKASIEIAKKGKWAWNKKHTMVPEARFFCVARSQKKDHAINTDGRPNILIDDMEKNIHEFEAAGGIGIHHTSAVSTITQLKHLGFRKI